MYTGHIYNKEGNPISGVKVSDGLNIATTDKKGFYSLPGWERANVISVQMLTENHDDWYRYIDKDLSVYDFYISPYTPRIDKAASFLHFSDSEIFLDGAYPHLWIDFVKKNVKEESPDFIIHTGDICRRKGLEYHRIAMNSQNMGVPVRYTLGNHDYVADKYGEYTFERLYGPVWYSFEIGETHFVVLPITKGDAPGIYKPEDSVRWLKNDLAIKDKNKKVVIFCHDSNTEFEKNGTLTLGEKTIDLLEYNALAWVFGHHHAHYVKCIDGRFHIGTGRPDFGGIDGVPAACRCVCINGDGDLTAKLNFNQKDASAPCEARRVDLGDKICFTAPIITEVEIFVATFSPDSTRGGRICKLSTSGELLNSFETEGNVMWSMAHLGGTIYALDDHGIVYYIDAESFALIKKIQLTSQSLPLYNGGVLTNGGLLYVATNNMIYEFDGKSGEVIRKLTDGQTSAISATSAPLFLDGMIIKGKHWRGLSAIRATDGQPLWFNAEVIDAIATPIAVGDEIIMPTRYHVAKLSKDGNILAKSASHSERFYNAESTPVYHEGKLYVPTTEVGIMVLDYETLEELYTFDCEGSLIAAAPYTGVNYKSTFGKPVIKDNTLIFTAADGKVYFYDIGSRELKKKINIGHPILSGVCETNEGYCVADFDGGISFIEE